MLHIQKASKALYEYSILNTSTAANTSDSIRNTPLVYNTGKIEVRIIQIYIYLENKSLQLLFLKFVYLKVRKKNLQFYTCMNLKELFLELLLDLP